MSGDIGPGSLGPREPACACSRIRPAPPESQRGHVQANIAKARRNTSRGSCLTHVIVKACRARAVSLVWVCVASSFSFCARVVGLRSGLGSGGLGLRTAAWARCPQSGSGLRGLACSGSVRTYGTTRFLESE
eukprot:3306068-Prymnesium_polylepis.1